MNTFLALTYSFMLAFSPRDSIGYGEASEVCNNSSHVKYELGLEVKDIFHVYTGEETWQVKDGSVFNWFPYQQTYYVGVEGYKEFSKSCKLTAGIKHTCIHPVTCWEEQKSFLNRSNTEYYISMQGTLPLF